MLEAIVGLRRRSLDEQEVGVGDPVQRSLQHRLINFGDVAQERIDEIASKHSADLRDFARGTQTIEPCCKRLLQSRWNRLHASLFAALHEQARYLLNEQRHAAGPLVHPLNQLLGKCMAGRDLADHARDAGPIQWGQRNQAVVRAQAPRRTEDIEAKVRSAGTAPSAFVTLPISSPAIARAKRASEYEQAAAGLTGPRDALDPDNGVRIAQTAGAWGHRANRARLRHFEWRASARRR